MDDKWAMFLEGNVLHLHRSWTGICIYQVTFERREGRFLVTEAMVESSADSLPDDLLGYLVDRLVGRSTPFPRQRP